MAPRRNTRVVYRAPKQSPARDADIWVAYAIRGVIVLGLTVGGFFAARIVNNQDDQAKQLSTVASTISQVGQKVDDMAEQIKALWGQKGRK